MRDRSDRAGGRVSQRRRLVHPGSGRDRLLRIGQRFDGGPLGAMRRDDLQHQSSRGRTDPNTGSSPDGRDLTHLPIPHGFGFVAPSSRTPMTRNGWEARAGHALGGARRETSTRVRRNWVARCRLVPIRARGFCGQTQRKPAALAELGFDWGNRETIQRHQDRSYRARSPALRK